MTSFSVDTLDRAMQTVLPLAFGGRLCVALSGGVDSTVLLHALAALRERHADWSLRAIHIDHQLQAESCAWAHQCERFAVSLDVPLHVERVSVERNDPSGLEAAARVARYDAIRRNLGHGEVLLTAHHADDQVETILLALLRGSGVQGLAAMPAIKPFANGWHVRPLLPFMRTELVSYAQSHQLNVIDDPANGLLRHDRNYLRHQVMPMLLARWPGVPKSAGRSAQHMGEALAVLDEVATSDLRDCVELHCLNINKLLNLSPSRRRNLIRYWLRLRGLPMPSTRKLLGLERDIERSHPERVPLITWSGVEVHAYRGLLYAEAERDGHASTSRDWDWHGEFEMESLGRLALTSADSSSGRALARNRLPASLTVMFRRGGERIRLPGRKHRHQLRNVLQENDVLPWRRDQLPLIYAGSDLIAVADLCIADEYAAAPGEAALQVDWIDGPEWRAVKPTNATDSV